MSAARYRKQAKGITEERFIEVNTTKQRQRIDTC